MTDSITPTQTLTPELVRRKLQIALTKTEQSIQGLNDAEAELVYNEDNIAEIAKFIDKCKAAEKVVETERESLKKPYLEAGRSVDAGAKLLSTELAAVRQKAHVQYTKLCQEVERKRIAAETERNRVATIKKAMAYFKTEYAVKISDAKTFPELVQIERLINLETANGRKYAEFLQTFRIECEAIRSLLAAQKTKVRQLSDLEKQEQEASQNGDDEQILKIQEKKEVLEAEIAQTGINVQETAVSQASNSTPEEPEEILPEIKGVRKYWKWQMIDEKAATKAGLTIVVPNEEKIKEILAEKRKGTTEVTENGIRYYQDRTF